jgi:hypothetical protein
MPPYSCVPSTDVPGAVVVMLLSIVVLSRTVAMTMMLWVVGDGHTGKRLERVRPGQSVTVASHGCTKGRGTTSKPWLIIMFLSGIIVVAKEMAIKYLRLLSTSCDI